MQFRIFNKHSDSYILNYHGIEATGIAVFDIFNSVLSNPAYRKEELIVEKYIGVTDRDKIKIFEGDIVEDEDGNRRVVPTINILAKGLGDSWYLPAFKYCKIVGQNLTK